MASSVGGVTGCWVGKQLVGEGDGWSSAKNIYALLGLNVGGLIGSFAGPHEMGALNGNTSGVIQGYQCVGSMAGKLFSGTWPNLFTSTAKVWSQKTKADVTRTVDCHDGDYAPIEGSIGTLDECTFPTKPCL